MSAKEKPKTLEISAAEFDALLERASENKLPPQDIELLRSLFDTILAMGEALDEKGQAVRNLLRTMFPKSEKSANLFRGAPGDKGAVASGSTNNADANSGQTTGASDEAVKAKAPGHGRNGADSYTGAEKKCFCHATLKSADVCPKCGRGKLYEKPPRVLIRVTGNPPLSAVRYELQRLRCALCGESFSATPPPEVGEEDERYDSKAISSIILLKYGTGMPFYRLETLQQSHGVPLPASTQWTILDKRSHPFYPVGEHLLNLGANGDLVHNDDTPAKILALMKEHKKQSAAGTDPPERKGMFTTGIISRAGDRMIALYATGRKHAGENLAALLKRRRTELPPPMQMCDGLARNLPGEFKTLLGNCLAHSRRNFVEVVDSFPAECQHVIGLLARVYWHDAQAKERNLAPQARLAYHQENSAPIMAELLAWMKSRFDKKLTEPNSGLGKAITYALKRWKSLTLFLREPGAPLDNNICERALKMAILSRKNAFFYKTMNGARLGDLFMGIIHTCKLCDANPFDYLTAVQENADRVAAAPGDWMPWNYKDAKLA